jgi:HEAT repeat protein
METVEAVAPVAAATRDSDDRVWRTAVTALGNRAARQPEALQALLRVLDARESARRQACVAALTGLTSEGPVLPALAKALKDPDTATQLAVRNAVEAPAVLPRLAKQGRNGAVLLGALLKHGSVFLRPRFLGLLKDMKAEAEPAVPEVSELLKDADSQVRSAAIGTLQAIGSGARGAARDLALVAKQDAAEALRQEAVRALEAMGREVAPEVAVVAGEGRDSKTRKQALGVLKTLGPEARAAVPLLVNVFQDPDQEVAAEAVRVVVRVGPAAVPTLTEKLADRFPIIRLGCVQALALIGPEAAAAVPVLKKRLKVEPLARIRTDIRFALKAIEKK